MSNFIYVTMLNIWICVPTNSRDAENNAITIIKKKINKYKSDIVFSYFIHLKNLHINHVS